MSPDDAAVAARSFPRRWRALFATVAGDDDPGDDPTGSPTSDPPDGAQDTGLAAEPFYGPSS